MFGKLRTIHLVLAVVLLGGLFWLSNTLSTSGQQRTFRESLMRVDTNSVNAFTLTHAPIKQLPVFHFFRDGAVWRLAMGPDTTEVDDAPMHELLWSISDMRVVRLVGRMDQVKHRYDLTDSTADELRFTAADGEHRLLVGRTAVNEERLTVVNSPEDDNAYAIPGDLGGFADKSFGDHMPKYLVRGDPMNWRRLVFQWPNDTGYVMERHGTSWTLDGLPTDSARVWRYMKSLAKAKGLEVNDPSDTLQAVPALRLIVEDTTRAAPITVVVYTLPGRFIVRSSLNPGTVMPFDGQSEIPRMFRQRSAFL